MLNILRPVTALLAAISIFAVVSCSVGAEQPSPETESPSPTLTPVPETRFASHVFVSPGQTVDISGYGEFLGEVHLSEPPAVSVSGDDASVVNSGISCLRFKYREVSGEGSVQTQCIVSFDETGNCDGFTPLSLDLEQNALSGQIPAGSNANLFESGQQDFYAACVTGEGRYRLQQPGRELPQLYFHIIDAYGEGPYSYGSSEFSLYRKSAVQTFSGEQLRPAHAHVMSGEINTLDFGPDGFTFVFDECSAVPACSGDADVLQPGDILSATWSAPMDSMMEIAESSATNGFGKWFTAKTGVEWEKVEQAHPDVKFQALVRLLSMDAMQAVIEMFDELYDVRGKQAPVAYTPFWPVYNITYACYPDEEERRTCREIEDAMRALEAEHIGALKDAGFQLWHGGNAAYDFDGSPLSWRENTMPPMELFDGYLIRIAANQYQPKETVPDILASVMQLLAEEMDGSKPVHLMVGGPPITGVTISEFCEADICTADFGPAYDQVEVWLNSALNSFAPGQVTGLSVALFDGTHYDILEPYETVSGVKMNRAAETGYNSPVLNIYRAP